MFLFIRWSRAQVNGTLGRTKSEIWCQNPNHFHIACECLTSSNFYLIETCYTFKLNWNFHSLLSYQSRPREHATQNRKGVEKLKMKSARILKTLKNKTAFNWFQINLQQFAITKNKNKICANKNFIRKWNWISAFSHSIYIVCNDDAHRLIFLISNFANINRKFVIFHVRSNHLRINLHFEWTTIKTKFMNDFDTHTV